MTYPELKNVLQELKRVSPTKDLTAHIIFTEDSFASPYSLISRTYLITSDNKGFRPNMFSHSIFAYCLDKTSDQGVRLEWYMADEDNADGWEVQECYILERMRDAAAIPNAERAEQEDGTVCWFFGDTRIRAREVLDGGKTRLEPVAGDQAACGEWVDLPIDRVYGYCTLLERMLAGHQPKPRTGKEVEGQCR